MPRPRFYRLPEDRRLALLDAAAAEFAVRGYDGASLNRIIAAAGISKGAFYYYFDDKADLLATVIERAMAALVEGVALDVTELRPDDFWQRLETAFVTMVGNAARHPWLAGIGRLFYAPPADEAVGAMVRAELGRAVGFLAAVVRRGRELGTVRTDLAEELTVAMLAGAAEAADRWLTANWESLAEGPGGPPLEALFDSLRRLVAVPGGGE